MRSSGWLFPGRGLGHGTGKNDRWFTSLCPTLLFFRRLVHTGSRGSDGSHEGPAGQPVLREGGGGLGADGGIACQENTAGQSQAKRLRRGGKRLIDFFRVFLAGKSKYFYCVVNQLLYFVF